MRTGYYVIVGLILLLTACLPAVRNAPSSVSATRVALIPTHTLIVIDDSSLESLTAAPEKESLLCEPIDDENMAAHAREVVELTNIERGRVGVGALTEQGQLTEAARAHAMDLACNLIFSHTGSDGSSPFDRMTRFGYRFWSAAENIAAGQASAVAVVQGWMDSPGHRENMLNPNFTEIGIGYIHNHADWIEGNYFHYWVMTLGQPAAP